MITGHKLSASNEDYLETILELCGSCDQIRSVEIAEHLISKLYIRQHNGIITLACYNPAIAEGHPIRNFGE